MSQVTQPLSLVMHTHAAINCSQLQDPTNGAVDVLGISFGSSALYTCNTGLAFPGHNRGNVIQRQCQANGTWSGSEPVCEGKQASTPIIPMLYVYSFLLELCTITLQLVLSGVDDCTQWRVSSI